MRLKFQHSKILPFIFLALLSMTYTACTGTRSQEKWDSAIVQKMPAITMMGDEPGAAEKQAGIGELFDSQTTDQAIDLSIEQAVMATIQYNRDLKIQRLEPVRAGTFEMIERVAFDPELFAEISYSREDIPTLSEADEETVLTEKTETSGLGLQKAFSTGTTVQAGIIHERTRSDFEIEGQEAGIALTLTQSLLRGFGPSVNLARVEQARLETALSLQELKGFAETIIADAEITYWQYVLARQKIAIFEQSLAIARKQRDEIEQQISVGLLPQTEAAAARSEVALQEQALINAQSTLEEQRLKLLYHISPGINTRFGLKINPTSSPDIKTLPITDLGSRVMLAEKIRPDINEARLRLAQNRLETVVTKNGILPRLDLFIALGRTGYGNSFSDAFKGIGDDNINDIQVGLSLNHLIGNRESEALHMDAVASRIQAQMAVDNLKKLINLDVRLAANEVERTKKQITASRTTRVFQEETSRAEKDRFDVGDSTTLLVTQAQRDLLIARINEVEAIVNFRIALVGLYMAEGSLLDLRGIHIGTDGNGL